MRNKKKEKFSDRFNLIFNFFLQSYRKGILTFAGTKIDVVEDVNSFCARGTFRRFDDGYYKYTTIPSRHPNVIKAVIIAKKSWGLHLKEWTDGIAEGLFLRSELLGQFEKNNIKIPEQFLKEFNNLIYSKMLKKI